MIIDLRHDQQLLASWIEPGSRVLDLGCGDGRLLEWLMHEKNCDARGIEIDMQLVSLAVQRGLAVIQGDAETDVSLWQDQRFDYVILSQTLPAIRNPAIVLQEMTRIGRHVLLSFHNQAHWRSRLRLGFGGRMPVEENGPSNRWYETEHIRPLTLRDFRRFCGRHSISIDRLHSISSSGHSVDRTKVGGLSNLMSDDIVAMIHRDAETGLRPDLRLIADLVPDKARILDVGCDDGQLLAHLTESRQVDARGIDREREAVTAALARGLSVIQGEALSVLRDYPDNSFDVVILSQTLQSVERPADVLREMLRIGQKCIVSITNYGHWRARLALMYQGLAPPEASDPDLWYHDQVLHRCTLTDFEHLCRDIGAVVEQRMHLDHDAGQYVVIDLLQQANLVARQAMYVLSKAD